MSVRDLLADLLDPPCEETSPPVAAKAANSAKTFANACSPVDLIPCEGLRKSAKTAPADPESRRLDVRARLLRWGWTHEVAEATADRIARREGDDDRATCIECAHFLPWRCSTHRRAGFAAPDVGRELAALPQRCPAFEPRGGAMGDSDLPASQTEPTSGP
jgi:hypothetical protein